MHFRRRLYRLYKDRTRTHREHAFAREGWLAGWRTDLRTCHLPKSRHGTHIREARVEQALVGERTRKWLLLQGLAYFPKGYSIAAS